jgi:DNA helicase-2/ATP-dependent DNA helicase PcrA
MPVDERDERAGHRKPATRTIKVKRPKRADSYRIPYERELNGEQHAVVTDLTTGPKLVLAGAGSGKTRVITYRVAYLLENGVGRENILMATFTNKAAREMLDRVSRLLQEDLRSFWGGTFHSLANRILRKHGELLGYRRDFTILDSQDAREVMNLVRAESEVKFDQKRFPRANLLCSIHSFVHNTVTPLEDVLVRRFPYYRPHLEEIDGIIAAYVKRKKQAHQMDYDDLLINLRRLLDEYPKVKEALQESFLHVLVDEYQDTNRLQSGIVETLADRHRNLMVVGDDSQSIYSFRGAEYDNIYRFPERFPDARVFKLQTNYRSSPEILDFANDIFRESDPNFRKVLKPIKPSGEPPTVVPCQDAFQQAEFVAGHVLNLREEGYDLKDIGILFRAHNNAIELELEFKRRGIPYQMRGGLRFFEQAHIKDVLSHLLVVFNPADELAFKRVMRLAKRVGPKSAAAVWDNISLKEDPFKSFLDLDFEFLNHRAARRGLEEIRGVLAKITAPEVKDNPSDMMDAVLEGPYKGYLKENFANYRARVEDLKQLAIFAETFESLREFLAEVSLLGGFTAEEIVQDDEPDEKVTLSTVHQAKGLEWPVVFLIHAADGVLPHAMSLGDKGGEEEERRLFYVASTRACDELYVSYPISRRSGDERRTILMSPSRFLVDLDEALYDEGRVEFEDVEEEEES